MVYRYLIAVALSAGAALAQERPVSLPEIGGANLPAQQIGPNDLIAVSVYDSPELSRTIRVGADGAIRLPMLKQRVRADGLLPAELETAVAEALHAEQLLVEPVVTVTIAEYHSRPISIAGAVRNPITFQAAGSVTLLDALTRAGGLGADAGPEILVSRMQHGEDGKTTTRVQRIPVRGLIDAADPEMNLKLVGGEEIRVDHADSPPLRRQQLRVPDEVAGRRRLGIRGDRRRQWRWWRVPARGGSGPGLRSVLRRAGAHRGTIA